MRPTSALLWSSLARTEGATRHCDVPLTARSGQTKPIALLSPPPTPIRPVGTHVGKWGYGMGNAGKHVTLAARPGGVGGLALQLFASIIAVLVLMAGCATVFEAPTYPLMITSQPKGARCELGRAGELIATLPFTPGTVAIAAGRAPISVTCSKPGFARTTAMLPPTIVGPRGNRPASSETARVFVEMQRE